MRRRYLRLGWALAALIAVGGCELIVNPRTGELGWTGHDGDGDGHGSRPGEGTGSLPDPDPTLGCEAVLCIEGTVCIETKSGPTCVPHEENPCNLVDCASGHACRVEQGEPVCVRIEGTLCGPTVCGAGLACCNESCGICTEPGGACSQLACDDPPVETCETTLMVCERGRACVDTEQGPECMPVEENPCHLVDCPPERPVCEVVEDEAVCLEAVLDACSEIECKPGHHCEELYPPCAPPPDGEEWREHVCEPIGACVKDEPAPRPCALVRCAGKSYCDDTSGKAVCLPFPSCERLECEDGSVCQLVEVRCIREPCPPQPSCVPALKGTTCGSTTCAEGEVCCNESCGICTKPGGFCTQQWCGERD